MHLLIVEKECFSISEWISCNNTMSLWSCYLNVSWKAHNFIGWHTVQGKSVVLMNFVIVQIFFLSFSVCWIPLLLKPTFCTYLLKIPLKILDILDWKILTGDDHNNMLEHDWIPNVIKPPLYYVLTSYERGLNTSIVFVKFSTNLNHVSYLLYCFNSFNFQVFFVVMVWFTFIMLFALDALYELSR